MWPSICNTRDLVLTAWISKYLPTPLCGCSTLGTWLTFPGLWSCLRSTTSRIAWPTWATSSTAGWTSPPRRRSTRSRYTWGDHFLLSAQEYLRRSFHFILREDKEFGPFLEKGNGKIKINHCQTKKGTHIIWPLKANIFYIFQLSFNKRFLKIGFWNCENVCCEEIAVKLDVCVSGGAWDEEDSRSADPGVRGHEDGWHDGRNTGVISLNNFTWRRTTWWTECMNIE